MDRVKSLEQYPELVELFNDFKKLHAELDSAFLKHYNRSLPLGELLIDRWERAQRLGFGVGSNIYDSSLVFGLPTVGANCWIGPFTIIDGSGGLTIGDYCTISAGVHIYSHDNLKATLQPDAFHIEKAEVKIGNHCYIAPNSIIAKGVTLGNYCVVAANSLVNKSFPDNSIIGGSPAKLLGFVEFVSGEIQFNYAKQVK